MSVDDEIAALVREGRNEEAAQRAHAAGSFARAGDLYAAVWRYAEAIASARAGQLLADAYRYALLAKDETVIAALLDELGPSSEQAARAVRMAEDRGRPADAARLARGLGDFEEAARFYERAGELTAAAECRLALGDARASGMLYERRLKEAPDDASAALALARILVSLGRHDQAARVLSPIARMDDASGADRHAADQLLVACFAALGMNDAAADVLDRLRKQDPRTLATVAELLSKLYGDPRGLVAVAQRDLVLGRYRVIATLGEGGTGRVFHAEDTFYGRDVALKAMHAGSGAAGRDALARFAREAKVAMGIDHPNVVRVLAYHAQGPYLVMERMEGGTLEDRLGPLDAPTGPLAPAAAMAIARAMLRALEAVHRRGVVHRDLKPANVLFTAGGDAKIADFGVAHLIDLGATMTGAMMGTIATMAPEQISGATQPDATTDLYAVGIVLFRMLTGRMPFEGADLAAAHLDEAPQAPTAFAPWLDASMDALLARLLAKVKEQRPSDASEALASLEALPVARYQEAWDKRAAQVSVPVRRSSIPPSAAPSSRYAATRVELDGTTLATDTLLERDVELRGVELEIVRPWAALRSPYVQAVYALDPDVAVLERPQVIDAAPSRRDLERALADVHAAGLVHGSIEARDLLVTRTGTLLRIPRSPTEATAADDLTAIDRLITSP